MSDGPVGINERMHFASQLHALDTRAEFVIHLGDIHERQKICNNDFLQQPADTMRSNLLVPILMVPGGNDYYECDDQKEAWKKWTNLFLGFEGNWTRSFTLERQSGRPENFVFVLKNILFLGVHVINATVTDWDALNRLVHDDAVWLEESVLAHLDQVGAIVIMAHAFPHSRRYREFYDTLVRITSEYSKKPFLYLQGNDKGFDVEHIFSSQNVLRVVMEPLGAMDPTEITVDPANTASPFKIKRHVLKP